MPPVSRSGWILRTNLDTVVIGAAFNAVPRVHNVCFPCTGKDHFRRSRIFQQVGASSAYGCEKRRSRREDTRRTLFELHAGREAFQLPTELALNEVTRPGSESNLIFNTSEELIAALGPLGKEYVRPRSYRNKVDLSFVDPVLAAANRKAAIEKAEEVFKRQKVLREEKNDPKTRKSVLVSYLLHVDPILRYEARFVRPTSANSKLDHALLKVFDDSVCSWLRGVQLDVKDFMNWAWILTADSSERAAIRLTLLANQCSKSEDIFRTIPSFLILFLLRRQSIDAHALKSILIYVWRLMEISASSMSTISVKYPSSLPYKPLKEKKIVIKDNINGMPEHIFMILIIRLMRRAAIVWPAACESVVALLNRYMAGNNVWKGISRSAAMQYENSAHLTYAYNTMLRLLSIPSSLHPFQSVIFQQRAQFSLLRTMDQFDPPLIVDKRGYKAVVKVQLMHKKTLKEREWAHMKAKSWPPWKEEKLGIDAHIGVEYGVSRGNEALNRAKEAGYSADEWDAAAGILSGWDTDGSPTIQTRVIYDFLFDTSKRTKGSRKGAVWAARVRATRTLDEAWSCFLACMDHTDVLRDVGEPVYFAMFMKLVYDAQRSSGKGKGTPVDTGINEHPLPGDGLEVVAAPESPRETTYVRQPPPSLDELLEMMVENGVQPSGRFLVFLLTKAWSFEAGVKCLEASAMHPQHLSALFDESAVRTPESQAALESVPKHIFAALIHFLTRFAPTMSDKHGHDRFEQVMTGLAPKTGRLGWTKDRNAPEDTPLSRVSLFNPLWRAYRLLIEKRPDYRPAWYHLIRALSHPKSVTGVYSSFAAQDFQDIKTWQITCKLLNRMLDLNLRVDLEGFGLICRGLEKAIFASERQLRTPRRPRTEDNRGHDLLSNKDVGNRMAYEHSVLSNGLSLVKVLFKDAVRSTGMQQEIPASTATEKYEMDVLVKKAQDEVASRDSMNEDQDQVASEDDIEHIEDPKSNQSQAFLPPACLLPKLLEVPHPAILHGFIRILGLRRDYDGILELIEWMSLYAYEINSVTAEAMNGRRMMRLCMIATRVFLERSWMTIPCDDGYDQAGNDGIVIEADPAPTEIIRAVRGLLRENELWGGWATNEELAGYCSRGRFL